MKNVFQWLIGHERPATLVKMMPRSVEGWKGTIGTRPKWKEE
jgi:hypothetical protein